MEQESSLYLKHRARTMEGIVGNESTVNSLSSILSRPTKKIPHSFLIHGQSGCGKTTLARIAATRLGCSSDDTREVDIADFRGIDTIREIRRQMRLRATTKDGSRCWILDEAHMMTAEAQNALLKALEDTPKHVYFFLCTTDPVKLKLTVRNRCTHFPVEGLDEKEMAGLLKSICEKEEKKVPSDVINHIVGVALGSARSAIVTLDMIIDLKKKDMIAAANAVETIQKQAIDLCRALIGRKTWKTIAPILLALQKAKENPEGLRRMILAYCNTILMKRDDARTFYVMTCFRESFFYTDFPGLTMACYSALLVDE